MRRLTLLTTALAFLLPGAAMAATEIAPVPVVPQATTAVATSVVVSAAPALLHGASITTGASGGYFLALNATADPGNGAVTPLKCVAVAANSSATMTADSATSWLFSKGIVLVFSTTGCFIEAQSATAFFSWQ